MPEVGPCYQVTDENWEYLPDFPEGYPGPDCTEDRALLALQEIWRRREATRLRLRHQAGQEARILHVVVSVGTGEYQRYLTPRELTPGEWSCQTDTAGTSRKGS